MIRASLIVVLLGGSHAIAQAPRDFPWAQLHLTWTEVDAVTGEPVARPNGVLNVGEAARISLSASFAPAGTPLSQAPDWTVQALRLLEFDMTFSHGPAQWRHQGVAAAWTNHTVVGSFSGSVLVLQDAIVDRRNPVVDLWHAIWLPAAHEHDSAIPNLACGHQSAFQRLGVHRKRRPTTSLRLVVC